MPAKKSAASLVQSRGAFRIAVRYVRTDSIQPAIKNPRLHSEAQIRKVAKSMSTFGFITPILVDEENVLVAGHCRLLAAKLLGLTEVPVISIDHLSTSQRAAYLLADNRLAEEATWDRELLRDQFLELQAHDLSFDLTSTGFEMGEIDFIIHDLSPPPDPDDVPIPLAEPVSRPSDLYQLGPHRLYCGSALDESSYIELMGGELASVVFSDPPFNVKVASISGKGKRKHREFPAASGEMKPREYVEFLRRALGAMARHSKDGSIHLVCIDWRHVADLIEAGESTYAELKNICVWAKDAAGMGSLWRSQHELILAFKHGTEPHQNHVQLGRYGRNRSNVWEYPCAQSFSRQSGEKDLTDQHPTPKPIAMIADALMDISSRGDLVLDPFGGSGSTLLAAERTGRSARLIDLDPRYVDLTIRRWERLTGKAAIHSEMQVTFDELRDMREGGRDG